MTTTEENKDEKKKDIKRTKRLEARVTEKEYKSRGTCRDLRFDFERLYSKMCFGAASEAAAYRQGGGSPLQSL